MNDSLRDVIRRVLSGSALVTGASTPLAAAVVSDPPMVPVPPSVAPTVGDHGTMVLRERRPRLVLKRASDMTFSLVSSHRSHRSHSSHRSHYSSSGGGGGTYTPPPPPPPPVRRPAATPPPVPSSSSYCVPADTAFGWRVLRRGMCGTDVTELMRLLVGHGSLPRVHVNAQAMFTEDVEVAVKRFQRGRGLTPDGEVGGETLRLLREKP